MGVSKVEWSGQEWSGVECESEWMCVMWTDSEVDWSGVSEQPHYPIQCQRM